MDIKEIRIRKGLTQSDAAAILGISRRTYQYLEGEKGNADSVKYAAYCKKLENSDSETDGTSRRFHTDAIYGMGLLNFADSVRGFKPRYCYKRLLDYIRNDYRGKVCILYGLRRTGKTTMLFQLLGELDPSKTVYIKAKEENTMGDLVKDLNVFRSLGFTTAIIDEVTLLEDFIGGAAALSDIYSSLGMKIVLSGTDSLGFAFADREELYDRSLMIHTSYISFKEFSEVLGIDDIDAYIEYGGTFMVENASFDDPEVAHLEAAFRDDESARKYIDTAISRNIQRSLRNKGFGNSFSELKDLYEAGELTNAINRIVQDMNHEFLLRVIEEIFHSSDFGSTRQMLLKSENPAVQTALYDVDEKAILERLKATLEIKEKSEVQVPVTKEAVAQIKQYLFMLDLIKEIAIEWDDGTLEKRVVFTQPGMRYCIAKALVHSLEQDPFFRKMRLIDREEIIERLLADVKGRMLEEIVLLETSLRAKGQTAFKYRFRRGGEFDMVTLNNATHECEIYEIKHSSSVAFEGQTKYLRDQEMLKSLEYRYGPIVQKSVLYRGQTKTEQGIEYTKVEDYLKGI